MAKAAGETPWWREKPPLARNGAELARVLDRYAGVYDKEIPADYNRALSLQSKATWDRMRQWYKLGSQKVMVLGKEAARLRNACQALDSAERALAGGAAAGALASAKNLLRFIDDAAWGEGLASPMRGEVRKAHLQAIADWEKVAACAAGD